MDSEHGTSEVKSENTSPKFLSTYAFKLGITLVVALMVSTSVSLYFVYNQTKPLLLGQMGSRLIDIGKTAAHLFGSEEFEGIEKVKEYISKAQKAEGVIVPPGAPGEYRKTLEDEAANRIAETPEYKHLYTLLRRIKYSSTADVNPLLSRMLGMSGDGRQPTLRFVSLFMPIAKDPERRIAQFIVDSDYNDATVPAPPGNLLFNNSDALRRAFDGEAGADPDFRFEQGMHILTAAVPLKNSAGVTVAVLSLYYDAGGEVNYVERLFNNCLLMVFASLVVALVFSFFLTWFLTRDIRRLTLGAARVRSCDFNVAIDVKRSDELGLLATTFNEMIQEIRRYSTGLEETNLAYSKFVPKQILEYLGQDSITSVKLGDQVQRQMTVLFADIRSFTSISESMSPRDNFDFINEYLRIIGPIIRHHNGFIDKYIGDAVMALFPDKPEDGVKAAVAMHKALEKFNEQGKETGRPAVKIGIGVHRGNLMLGTVGEEERMDGTVISDAVNLTSRLEGLTKQFGAPIIVSEAVMEAIQGKRGFESRYLGELAVKGKQRLVRIFEVLDGDELDIARRKAITVKEFERAVKTFEKGEVTRAVRQFGEVLRLNSGDIASKYYLKKCKEVKPTTLGSERVIKVDEERFKKKG